MSLESMVFGAKHIRGDYPQNTNRYDFNGKEEQTTGGLKYLDYGARMYDSRLGRWFNVDPLAEKYYPLSPYNYCANNPIKFIDPNGMWMDDYLLKLNGDIVFMRSTADSFDMLYNERNSQSIKLNDKGILPELTRMKEYGRKNPESYVSSSSYNAGDMLNMFVFAADNSNSEWSFNGYKGDRGLTEYVLSRFGSESYRVGHAPNPASFGYDDFNLVFKMHSHPGVDGTKGASGDFPGGITADMLNISKLYYKFQDANKPLPPHYIYHPYTQTLYHYTPWVSDQFIKRVTGGSSFNFPPFRR